MNESKKACRNFKALPLCSQSLRLRIFLYGR